MNSALALPLVITRESGPVQASLGFATRSADPFGDEDLARCLHPAEERQWRSYKYPRRRDSFLLGRVAAKAALGACFPSLPLRTLEIANGIMGQPRVTARSGVEAEVSLSHSENFAAAITCAAGHPIGIDLEFLDSDRAAVAQSCLAPGETAVFAQLDTPAATSALLLWCMRESLGKVLRCGLTAPFAVLGVQALQRTGETYTADFRNFPQYRATGWLLGSHILCLALPRKSQLSFEPPDVIRRFFPRAVSTDPIS